MSFNVEVERIQEQIELMKQKYAYTVNGSIREEYFYQQIQLLNKKLKEEENRC